MNREDTVRDAYALMQAIQQADPVGEHIILDNCDLRSVALYLARTCAVRLRNEARDTGTPLPDHMAALREINVRTAATNKRPRF